MLSEGKGMAILKERSHFPAGIGCRNRPLGTVKPARPLGSVKPANDPKWRSEKIWQEFQRHEDTRASPSPDVLLEKGREVGEDRKLHLPLKSSKRAHLIGQGTVVT